MKRLFLAAVAVLACACGDNTPLLPDARVVRPDPGLLAELQALPGVTAVEMTTETSGYAYYVLHFTQPVDHDDPTGPTFQQEVSLLHADPNLPMIVETDGYWDYTLDYPVELTQIFGANQISIEHRYFAASTPANPDWTKLTIAQMAADEHAIVTALKTIYKGPFVSTGASKGGMTAVYFRRFYPDDVVGTVPYVAPLSFAAPDERYATFLDNNGTPACHAAVRAAAVEMLSNRRAALETAARAEASSMGESYTRVAIEPATESAILGLEWSFWQYHGVGECGTVPAVTATDDQMWTFLSNVSPVDDSDDEQIDAFAPYDYQAYFQLGYPDGGEGAYLGTYEMYNTIDYEDIVPVGATVPTYDGGSAMHDIDGYVQTDGADLVFVYGQWDPWTAGAFTLGNASDALLLIEAEGTHGSDISGLATGDQNAALAKISAWLGVAPPVAPRVLRAGPKPPHVPSAIARALRSHKP